MLRALRRVSVSSVAVMIIGTLPILARMSMEAKKRKVRGTQLPERSWSVNTRREFQKVRMATLTFSSLNSHIFLVISVAGRSALGAMLVYVVEVRSPNEEI
jgi:hypothetical protein